MATKAPWASQYMIQQTSSLTDAPTFVSTTKVGLEGTAAANGVYRMGLTNTPHIIPGIGTIEHPTTTGLAEPFTTMDYSQVVGEPASVTLEMPLNAYNFSLFMLLLFQGGCSEAAGKLTAVAYTSSAPTYYCSVVRVMVDNTATKPNVDEISHILYGGICKTLTISSGERDILKLTAEIAGSWARCFTSTDLPNYKMLIANISATYWNSFAFMSSGQEANRTPLKFQACTSKIELDPVGAPGVYSTVGFDKFSITFTNNAVHRYYANSSIQSWILGRLKGTGSVTIPWGDTNYGGNSPLLDFIAGQDFGLRLYTNDGATTDNSIDLTMNVRLTESPISTDPEISSDVTFEGVYDGTNAAFSIKAGYSATYLDRIP